LRFLIARLSSLGDVACSLPAAGALKRAFPDAVIEWVVDPRFAGVVECCRHVDRTIAAKPGLAPSSWPQFEVDFEAALDLQGLLKSALSIGRAKAGRKLGYHWQREGAWLFSQPVLPDPTSVHIVDQYVDVARAAGGQAERADFGLVPMPDDLASVRNRLPEGRFVAINAGAGWATKRWPAASFAFLADRLHNAGVATVLIGGKASADREAADAVLSTAKNPPRDLLGQTSVRELIALLSLAEAHVGGDTGSTHLMAALGRTAVGLYSITRPKRSCPYGQAARCHYDPEGLARIAPEAVTDTVLEALS
jgi:heptosyltransferase I